MTLMADTYSLRSSGDYADPRSENERLPVIYGDLATGMSAGQWKLICIDTASFVYAYAGSPVLSEANGNSVTLFDKDGAEISSGWSFNHANNYEGLGSIATITFTADAKAKEPITAKGCGRDDGSGGLITNPVYICEDFLTDMAGFSSDDLNTQTLARAAEICEAQSYTAAGMVAKDQSIGATISEIMGCFLGDWRKDAEGLICLRIDLGPGAVRESEVSGWIGRAAMESAEASCHLAAVCNLATAQFAYSWAENGYQVSDNGDGTKDAISIGLYGERRHEITLPWVRTASVAAKIQAIVTEAYAWPRMSIRVIDPGLSHAFCQAGDYIWASCDWLFDDKRLPLRNQLYRIISTEISPDPAQITLNLLDTGSCLTTAETAGGDVTAGGDYQAGGARDRSIYS